MEIYLVRHGQTDWNKVGKIQGHADIPLNDTGREQAARVAEILTEKTIDEIYCSSMKRAVETASIIADRLGKPAYMTDGLIEMGYGDCEGLTGKEIEERFPQELAAWYQNPMEFRFPGEGGETEWEVLQRAYGSWKQIVQRAKGNVVIVSHGATLRILLHYLLRDTPEDIPEDLDNVSVVSLHYNRLTEDIALIR